MSEVELNKLDCHFKWNPVDSDEESNLDQLIEKQIAILDEDEDFKPFKLSLIGYLYTRVSSPNYTKALEYLEKCIELTEIHDIDSAKGHKYVATANKIHTLNCMGNQQDEIIGLLESLDALDTLPDKGKAVVMGHRGFTFSHFGKTCYLQSSQAYSRCMNLDPNNYLWPWGMAFAAGSLRRIVEGSQTKANDLEETNLRKAIALSEEQKSLPIIILAELLFNNSRNFQEHCSNLNNARDPNAMTEAGQWFKKAYMLSPDSPEVLMRYGKYYNVIGEKKKGMAMLKDACELNPYSSQAWFRLGQAYRFAEVPDLIAAEECHVKAITAGHKRHFWAEIHLGWIRIKINNQYDLVNHFEEMRQHYQTDDTRQEMIDAQIKRHKDFQSRGKPKVRNFYK